jgi:hypothetical protein
MAKYILKRDLPLAKAGTEVELQINTTIVPCNRYRITVD